MPTYEMNCTACDHAWEVDQRISDEPIRTCPKCGEESAKRLISRTSFNLKGSGWAGDNYGARPPPPTVQAPKSSGPSEATMATATTCPTSTPVKP